MLTHLRRVSPRLNCSTRAHARIPKKSRHAHSVCVCWCRQPKMQEHSRSRSMRFAAAFCIVFMLHRERHNGPPPSVVVRVSTHLSSSLVAPFSFRNNRTHAVAPVLNDRAARTSRSSDDRVKERLDQPPTSGTTQMMMASREGTDVMCVRGAFTESLMISFAL